MMKSNFKDAYLKKKLGKSSFRIVLSLFVLIMILGVSYALFSQTLIGEKNYSITSGNLKVYLNEKTAENISIKDAKPVRDEVGKMNPAYEFSLVNEGQDALEYTIYLKEEDLENKTPSSAIRYQYTRDVGNLDITRNLEESKTEDGRYYLETGIVPSKTTYQYEYRMWLNENAGNEAIETVYSLRIEIEAIQVLKSVYKESILNGCDPVLSDNLIPVVIEDDGTVRKADIKEEWYNYSNRRWANAIVLESQTNYSDNEVIPESNIQSYFVWIPRYKYKLFNMGNYSSLTGTSTTAVQTIDVVFESKKETPSVGTKVGDYHSHPAFQSFDSNGFWVGKFESGYKAATTKETAQIQELDTSKLIIKPDVYSWREISIGAAFTVSYYYLRDEESHMMKNTEWGAVAYLQHSIYGSRASVRVNNNSSYLTGYASVTEPTCGQNENGASSSCNLIGTAVSVTKPYNTEIGYTASTTGNVSGVYDMSGGAWEYVMATNENVSTDKSELKNYFSNFFEDNVWNKYYDKYTVSSNFSYNARILGDATGEMGPFMSATLPYGSWYDDEAYYFDSSNAWLGRGGYYPYGSKAGIFTFSVASGEKRDFLSFRVVLAL